MQKRPRGMPSNTMGEDEILEAFTVPDKEKPGMEQNLGSKCGIGRKPKGMNGNYPAPISSYGPPAYSPTTSLQPQPAYSSYSSPPLLKRQPMSPIIAPLAKPKAPTSRPYQCNACGLTFSLIDEVSFHMLRTHCTALHECPYCQATSNDFSGLRIHVDLAHKGELQAWERTLTSGTPDCVWCQSQAKHQTHCLIKKGNRRRESPRP